MLPCFDFDHLVSTPRKKQIKVGSLQTLNDLRHTRVTASIKYKNRFKIELFSKSINLN